MFERLTEKLTDLSLHHQVAFALITVISIVCVSWGVELLLKEYIFPEKPVYAALIAIIGGLFFLWLTKHVVLHVI